MPDDKKKELIPDPDPPQILQPLTKVVYCQFNINPDLNSSKEIPCGKVASWRWPPMEDEEEGYFCQDHYDRVKRYMMMQQLDHNIWLIPIIPMTIVDSIDVPEGFELVTYAHQPDGTMKLIDVTDHDKQQKVRAKIKEMKRRLRNG